VQSEVHNDNHDVHPMGLKCLSFHSILGYLLFKNFCKVDYVVPLPSNNQLLVPSFVQCCRAHLLLANEDFS